MNMLVPPKIEAYYLKFQAYHNLIQHSVLMDYVYNIECFLSNWLSALLDSPDTQSNFFVTVSPYC
jgi:hypothetical protein